MMHLRNLNIISIIITFRINSYFGIFLPKHFRQAVLNNSLFTIHPCIRKKVPKSFSFLVFSLHTHDTSYICSQSQLQSIHTSQRSAFILLSYVASQILLPLMDINPNDGQSTFRKSFSLVILFSFSFFVFVFIHNVYRQGIKTRCNSSIDSRLLLLRLAHFSFESRKPRRSLRIFGLLYSEIYFRDTCSQLGQFPF